MSADIIDRVTVAIQKRLQAALAAADKPEGVFVGALDEELKDSPSLILFLYRITPSVALRNDRHVVAPLDGTDLRRVYEHSLPLDLHFLLTVRRGAPEPLRLLGLALQAINGAPNLMGSEVNDETVRLLLDPVGSEEMSRIWSLFPTVSYRSSVALMASPAWVDPAAPEPAGPPVVTSELEVGQ